MQAEWYVILSRIQLAYYPPFNYLTVASKMEEYFMYRSSGAVKYLIAGAFAMLFLGAFMLWSIFAAYVKTSFMCSDTDVTNMYTFFLSFFCLGALLCGKLRGGEHPRKALLACAALIGGGYMLCSITENLKLFFIGYSILNGIGVGFAYNAILAAVVPWFPGRSGFATGVLFMGYGLCGTIFSMPVSNLLKIVTWRDMFLILSFCSAVVLVLVSYILRPVAATQEKTAADNGADSIPPAQMIRSSSFILYFIWVVLLLAGGMVLNGTAALCAAEAGLSLTLAAASTSVLSFSGAISRIIIGEFYDHKGYRLSMAVVQVLYLTGCIMLLGGLHVNPTLLFLAYPMIGFSYGSLPTISSPFVLTFYGKKYYAQNFSVLGLYTFFSSMCGPFLFSIALSKFDGSFSRALLLLPLLGIVACMTVMIFFLTRQKPSVNYK